MKKNKVIAIFCLLFLILIVFVVCSSSYLSKKNVNKEIVLAVAVNQGEGGSSKGNGLTKEEVEEELEKLETAPTYDELLKIAKEKYNMTESVFQVVFGWAIGEGYDNSNHYLGYLCDNIGINHYMKLGKNNASTLASSIGGYDRTGYYDTSRMQGRSISAKKNPNTYANIYKGMYLALKYPEQRAHDCDGVSNYSGYGGKKLFSAREGRYTINVWTLWYDGFKHWNDDGKYSDNRNSVLGGGKDTGTVILDHRDPRIDYADLCKAEGFRTGSKIAGIVILVAKWLAPLILIILGMTDFIKALVSNEDNSLGKAVKIFIIRMVIAIIIPFIPGLLYYLADYFIGDLEDETGELVSCTECIRNPFDCEVDLYDYDNQK